MLIPGVCAYAAGPMATSPANDSKAAKTLARNVEILFIGFRICAPSLLTEPPPSQMLCFMLVPLHLRDECPEQFAELGQAVISGVSNYSGHGKAKRPKE